MTKKKHYQDLLMRIIAADPGRSEEEYQEKFVLEMLKPENKEYLEAGLRAIVDHHYDEVLEEITAEEQEKKGR
jgi:hypothetical protein